MQSDSMVDNPMISYTEPKQIKQPIDEPTADKGRKALLEALEEVDET